MIGKSATGNRETELRRGRATRHSGGREFEPTIRERSLEPAEIGAAAVVSLLYGLSRRAMEQPLDLLSALRPGRTDRPRHLEIAGDLVDQGAVSGEREQICALFSLRDVSEVLEEMGEFVRNRVQREAARIHPDHELFASRKPRGSARQSHPDRNAVELGEEEADAPDPVEHSRTGRVSGQRRSRCEIGTTILVPPSQEI